MTLNNINTVARYETKLLRRSWLFRIFAILALLGVTGVLLLHTTGIVWRREYIWMKVAVASFYPFYCIYFYNIVQSVIAVFLAGNFLQRDKKLDTAEVIYVRPMSNADYIVGKTLGILRVFVSLHVVMLLITAFVNVLLAKSPFSVFPYVFYLVTISIPSLLFVLGLSFMVMCVVKNQAITFVVMLGVIGMAFFYLNETLFGVFDFFGVNIPSAFSEVTGHADIRLFLLQRSIFLLSGIGLLCLTVALVKRLPHKPWQAVMARLTGIVCVLAGLAAGGLYVLHYRHQFDLRNEYNAMYVRYGNVPKADVLGHRLTVAPCGELLEGKSVLQLGNRHAETLEKLYFYLNPSLKVVSASINGEAVEFAQKMQIVAVDSRLRSGEVCTLTLAYEGGIDESICYTDVLEKDYMNTKHPFDLPLRIGKRYAWLEKDYTLLTPECLWYPVTVSPVNPVSPYDIQKAFTDFSLAVVADSSRTVLSQGQSSREGDTVRFMNRTPLAGISLSIADYERKSVRVDSVDYTLYYFKGHDYFSEHFSNLKDTLLPLIRELKNDIEIKIGRDYPFDKFVMAETPVQFESYVRNWKGYTEYIQPEIVFVPERGSRIYADFGATKRRMRGSRWGNQDALSEQEVEINIFRMFFDRVFTEEMVEIGWGGTRQINPFNITSMFYGQTGFVRSEEYPVLDRVLNLVQNTTTSQDRFSPWQGYINDKQKANYYLETHSFRTAMADTTLKPEIFYELLKLKSVALNYYITSRVGAKPFNRFLKDFYAARPFSVIPFDTLNYRLQERFGLDISDFLREWYTIDYSPTLYVKSVDANEVVIDEYTKYQVKFKVHNPSEADAILTAQIHQGGGGGRGPRGGGGRGFESVEPQHYIIPANSAREIKIITDERPSNVMINTNISHNLPNVHFYNFSKIENSTDDTTSGMFAIDASQFKENPREIIIDNEDAGFRMIASNNRHKLKDLFRKPEEDKYRNFRPWWAPSQWTSVVADYYYGETIHSAVYKSKGSGANSVEWKAEIKREGYYELSVWNPKSNMFHFGGRRDRREEREQTYTLHTGQEMETFVLDLERENEGWVSVGNFYLPKGSVTLTLTDKVSGNYVIADAIKFTIND